MAYCEQRWHGPGKPGVTWTWAIMGSLVVHGLLVGVILAVPQGKPAPQRVVVPVEAVTLVPYNPGTLGGAGQHSPVTRPAPSPPKPATPPVQPPRKRWIKPKRRPRVKLALPHQPTKAPVIPTPAPAPAVTRAKPAPVTATISQSGAPGAASHVAGRGQGGAGGGRGSGSGSGVGSGRGLGSGSGSALSGYLLEIRRLLEKHKDYPWMARRRHLQGVVAVIFTIGSGGQIESARISRSSGHAILDEAAQNTIRRVGQFPPFPAALHRQKLTIEVPLAFRLRTY